MSQGKKRSQEETATAGKHKRKEEEVVDQAKEEEEIDESMLVDDNGLVFEDPFYDEFEEELVEENEEEDDESDDEDEEENDDNAELKAQKRAAREAREAEKEKKEKDAPKQFWRPGVDKLPEGEELEYDPSAYIMYHSLQTEWPCLSFDVLRDTLGDNRQRYPQTMFLVTGTQADRAEKNKITLLKLSDLHKTHVAADSDEESDGDEDLDEDPIIEHAHVPHNGGVNRIRSCPQQPGVVAAMSDSAEVSVFDLSHTLKSFMTPTGQRVAAPTKPLFTYKGHRDEGFALDWSPVVQGRLATGDCAGKIHLWTPNNSGGWAVDASKSFSGHTSSVEDLQWSPSESTVFASCSADKTVRIWDSRDHKKPQITFQAHSEDVNVISWNKTVGYLLASGSDDASFKVWDLRAVAKPGALPLAHFTYHTGAITSIEWSPHDESMLSVSSEDNQLSVWDLSVEADDADAAAASHAEGIADLPPQLLFLHCGQRNIKELHFHPQIPGTVISTAEDSFNIFKPAITVSS